MKRKMVRFIADHKQKLKKLLPKKLLRAAKLAYLTQLMAKYQKEPIHPAEYQKKEAGVNLIGDIRAEIGLGQSMRLLANELELSKIPFGIYNFQLDGNVRRGDHSFEHQMREDYPYRVNLFHVNPQEVGLAYLYLNKDIWRDRYNIAFWLWELEEFPQEYQEAIKFFDEIWTPSEFASSSIRKVTDKPVYTLPYYVTAGKDENCGRADFGLPEDKFLYLIMYDTNSTMARKNPVGALDAYKKAFPVEDEHVGLVIKMNNPKQEDLEVLREQTKGYQNLYLIAEVLDKPKVNSLIAAVDVFVSLHRAEGFGLVMAEAMLLDTVCVATDWSSNTEFMDADSACMVSFRKVEIQETSGNYKKGYRWAEPNVEEAAGYMRRLYEDPAYYDRLAKNGKAKINEVLGAQTITAMLKERLTPILQAAYDAQKTVQ